MPKSLLLILFLLSSFYSHAQISGLSGTNLSTTSSSLSWTDGGADPSGPISTYWIYLGSSVGAQNYGNSGQFPAPASTRTVTGSFPSSGTIYARLWHKHGATWKYNDTSFPASSIPPPPPVLPSITSPTPASSIPAGGFTLTWSSAGFSLFWIYVGTTSGSSNLLNTGQLPSGTTSYAIPGVYSLGTFYVRLWYKEGSAWKYVQTSYTSGPGIVFNMANPLSLTAGASSVSITATGSPSGGTMTFSSTNTTSGILETTGGTTSGTISFTPHIAAGGTAVISCTYTISGIPVSLDYTIIVTPSTPTISFDSANPLGGISGGDSMLTITATGSPATGLMSFTTSSNTSGGVLVYSSGTTSGTITFTPHAALGGTAVISCTYSFPGTSVSSVVSYTINVDPISLVVTIPDNAGDGSLRDKAYKAELLGGGTVTFDPSLTGATIELDSEIVIATGTIVIQGLGTSTLTMSGQTLTPLFRIESEASVTINDMTLTEGNNTEGPFVTFPENAGGAILSFGNLTINNCNFDSNTSSFRGGAIAYGASLIINSSTFTSNLAEYDGGAITNFGTSSTAILTDCSFLNNLTNIYSGGAIYHESGSLTIDSSVFDSNRSYFYGGGAIANAGTSVTTITNSSFTENYTDSAFSGGAIRNDGLATMNISSTSFNDNYTLNGGNGGAINNEGELTLETSTFSGNNAVSNGGAIYNSGTLSIIFSGPVGVYFIGNSASSGGGIYNTGSLTITETVGVSATYFTENAASSTGGGIYNTCSGVMSIDPQVVLSGNTPNNIFDETC